MAAACSEYQGYKRYRRKLSTSFDNVKSLPDRIEMSVSIQSNSAKTLTVHQLSIANAFNGLTPKERLYSHHLARAAWSGTRIILRQVSPEANSIFDFIMELARCCRERFSSSWAALAETFDVNEADMASFLKYAARFLSNIGNYYVMLPVPRSLRRSLRFRVRAIKNSGQKCTRSL